MTYLVSFIVFVATSYLLRRRFDQADIPRGPTRAILIFTLALAVSYTAEALLVRIFG